MTGYYFMVAINCIHYSHIFVVFYIFHIVHKFRLDISVLNKQFIYLFIYSMFIK